MPGPEAVPLLQVAAPPDGGEHLRQVGLGAIVVVHVVGGHQGQVQAAGHLGQQVICGSSSGMPWCHTSTRRAGKTRKRAAWAHMAPSRSPSWAAPTSTAPCRHPVRATRLPTAAASARSSQEETGRSFSPRNWARVTKPLRAAYPAGSGARRTKWSVGGRRSGLAPCRRWVRPRLPRASPTGAAEARGAMRPERRGLQPVVLAIGLRRRLPSPDPLPPRGRGSHAPAPPPSRTHPSSARSPRPPGGSRRTRSGR